MAARLRHALHDIAVPAGTFLIGRAAECQLALDDALVSRRHAAIRVDEAGAAMLEDLSSRNGVFLNGVRITQPEPLTDGDRIRIGSQDIGFVTGDAAPTRPRNKHITLRALPPVSDDAVSPSGGSQPMLSRGDVVTPLPPQGGVKGTTPLRPRLPDLDDLDDPDDTESMGVVKTRVQNLQPRFHSGLGTICGVADKAFALGRAEEAERILQRALAEVLDHASTGEVDVELAERAAFYAVRLAATTGHGSWIDYVIQLYLALGVLTPGRLVDELYAAVRKVKHTNKGLLRTYSSRMKELSATFGPAERFVQQRLEGLARSVF